MKTEQKINVMALLVHQTDEYDVEMAREAYEVILELEGEKK